MRARKPCLNHVQSTTVRPFLTGLRHVRKADCCATMLWCLEGRFASIPHRAAPPVPSLTVSSAWERRARNHVITAAAGERSAAAASRALAADHSDFPSTSSPSVSEPIARRQWQGSARNDSAWSYKYRHFPCASPVDPADVRCMQIEALFQNVLGYPRLPASVFRYLQKNVSLTVEQVTATAEGLDARYGKELVLYMVRRAPWILAHTAEEMANNADTTRSMLDLKGCELFMVLRKNPMLLTMDPTVVRTRYNSLHRITPLSHEDVKAMARKYPLVLSSSTEVIAKATEKLRHLAYTRAMWQQDFEVISPSLLAYYLRDYRDQLLRLEYLALTGDSATSNLYKIFKQTNSIFRKKHRGFREWANMRIIRRQQMQMRAQLASQRVHKARQEVEEEEDEKL